MAELKSPVLTGLQEREAVFSNGRADCYPISALIGIGSVLMRLELTEEERRRIDLGHDVFVEILTAGGLQPMRFTVADRDDAGYWESEGYPLPDTSLGNRNTGLLALARLAKSSGSEWEEAVRQYNATCVKPPLPEEELEKIFEEVR